MAFVLHLELADHWSTKKKNLTPKAKEKKKWNEEDVEEERIK